MIPQSHSIDNVPHVDGIQGPERFAEVFEDGVDGRVGVVDEDVEFAILILLDRFEQIFNFGIVAMIHLGPMP